MILQISNITKSFDGKDIIKDCSFHMEENEKCALIGYNGAGKSTLLNIINKRLTPDSGTVSLKNDCSMGYLLQSASVDTENTIYEELVTVKQDLLDEEKEIRSLEHKMKELTGDELQAVMKRYDTLMSHFEINNGYAVNSEITGILKGLGFNEDDFSNKISTLSGGQKTRVALGKLLLSKPDLIMLDEPTNHLDLASIEFLEGFLRNYSGAVLIVAHDRYFLDRIVTKVFELENGHLQTFTGNYSSYAEKKKKQREDALKAYLNNQEEIRHQEEVIAKLKSFNREKSIKRAESREKLLAKTERVEKPVELNTKMSLKITPSIVSGKDVLSVSCLAKSFPNTPLFDDISFDITRGERVALIGNNGTGKTTMLKILTGNIPADSGSFRTGTNVKIGYYDQEHQVLHSEKTLFEEISDEWPDMDNTRIRNTLASFLFYGDDVFKQVGKLSGGERGRLSLAKLMLGEANFLILDEPTNHLDIASKEILENALNEYEGTVFFVSHDRYFINSVATRILDLTKRNDSELYTIINYIGNYDYYTEKKDELTGRILNTTTQTGTLSKGKSSASSGASDNSGRDDWMLKKAEKAKQRKLENDLKKCEEEIETLEQKQSEINELLLQPEIATDVSECTKLTGELESITGRLDELYELWGELSES